MRFLESWNACATNSERRDRTWKMFNWLQPKTIENSSTITNKDGKSRKQDALHNRHPMNQLQDGFARGKAKLENTRLPEIVVKVKKSGTEDSVPSASISLPFIRTNQKEIRIGIAPMPKGVNSEKTAEAKSLELVESALPNIEANVLPSRNRLPRVLSAPKTKREESNQFEVFTTRPSSACETVFLEN